MARRPSMAGSEASPKMIELDQLDERELRAARNPEPPKEGPKYPVAPSRLDKKRCTAMVEPELHRKVKMKAAADGVTIEEAIRIGLQLFLDK